MSVYTSLGYHHAVSDVQFHPLDHIIAFCSFGDSHPVLVYHYDPKGLFTFLFAKVTENGFKERFKVGTKGRGAGTSPFLCTYRTHVAGTLPKLLLTKRILVHFYVVAGTVCKSRAQ